METIYEVYITDTLHGSSDKRTYKTLAAAMARYEHLKRTTRRNGHNTVCLDMWIGDKVVQIYPEPILGR
jgi:hypothetical protein